MLETHIYSPRWYDPLLSLFFRVAASGLLPASWFRAPLPDAANRNMAAAMPELEIVSHCWQYSNMLAYQLSSIVNHPPTKLRAVVTVFYAEEDRETQALLDYIAQHKLANVRWNWQVLPKEKLFRRGIGRNIVALSTRADWLWFTDCDVIFHANCFDSLADELQGRRDIMLYPKQERTTPMLAASDPVLEEGRSPQLVDINADQFSCRALECATGPFQIVHGDVARVVGYCDGMSLYQTPSQHWCKCYEDRAFRWSLGTQGIPVDIEGIYRIRHIYKGRYKKGSRWSRFRSEIRRMQG